MRTALFVTCVVDTAFPETGRATVRLLRRLGVDVDFPQAQTCCGQMHLNSGYRDAARSIARHYLDTFDGYDHVVVPSASCAGAIRHEHEDLLTGPEAARARSLGARTLDLSEYLIEVLGVTDVGSWFPAEVTYHPTCHSLRVLGVGERPLRLLGAVEGLRLRPLEGAEECCGFGGTFSVKVPEVSAAIVDDKAAAVEGSGARVLCATDRSCLMNIEGALRRRGSDVRALHLAEILASTREEPSPMLTAAAGPG